ncbi:hypothetical protein ES332_D03G066200v1 [Gossypium tomentosum]|uniref:Uncharacterized protein n=1 Tax=Gossypium tomentosum TaxID=34277 RepID=A0A5D2LLC4_GOSTO|nr:hypothetical protein ES332_D03G066200v1 [Gossypium tomentosum]
MHLLFFLLHKSYLIFYCQSGSLLLHPHNPSSTSTAHRHTSTQVTLPFIFRQ